MTEICGPPGAGKTQICMLLSVTALLLRKDALAANDEVLYVDTEGSFVPERVEEIALGVLGDTDGARDLARQALSHIQYVRVHTQVEQLALVTELSSHLERHR